MKGFRESLTKIFDLLTEVRDTLWKENAKERIKQLEWQVDTLRGNETEFMKRMTALEVYLGVEFKRKEEYTKK